MVGQYRLVKTPRTMLPCLLLLAHRFGRWNALASWRILLLALIACQLHTQTLCHVHDGTACEYKCTGTPRYSRHKCFGETPDARSCIFRNLYYNVEKQEFIYFLCPKQASGVLVFGRYAWSNSFQANESSKDDIFLNEYFLRHSDGIEFLPGQGDLRVKISVQQGEPPTDPAELSGLNVLWSQCCGGPTYTSFGHFLLQSWFPMFRVLQDLNVLSHNFQLLVLKAQGDQPLRLFQNYFRTFTVKVPRLWPDVICEASAENKSFIRFCEVVIGAGGYTANMARQYPLALKGFGQLSAGTSRAWADFRAFMMKGVGLKEPKHSNVFRIVLNDKGEDKRCIGNLDELEKCLSHDALSRISLDNGWKVPFRSSVARVNFRTLNVTEQLENLSRTSIFITTQGSSAFRWVFLPPGAVVIVLGAPDGLVQTEYPAFFEGAAWFSMSQVKFYKYPVLQHAKSEYDLDLATAPNGNEALAYWNADIKPECNKLGMLVAQAIRDSLIDLAMPKWGQSHL